jgi:hypothetical protein
MDFVIPRPMKVEHDELHDVLRKATKEAGELGEAAQAVARVLHPHFVKEEEFALPPLGLLPRLARGEVTPEMAEVLGMTDKIKAELGEMLGEHKAIVAALETFAAAATRAKRPEYAEFARKLILHAQTEEEVSYPTAILIGEFVKSKLKL